MSKTIEAIEQINQLRFTLSDKVEHLTFDQILRETGSELISRIRSEKSIDLKRIFPSVPKLTIPKATSRLFLKASWRIR